MSPEARADMAASCLEVWRDAGLGLPLTGKRARDMVSDDLVCLGIDATVNDVADIAARIMRTLLGMPEPTTDLAEFWTAAATRSDS